MNISKFTQKSIQAIQDCEKYAYEYGNQEIAQEHFLYALDVYKRQGMFLMACSMAALSAPSSATT